MAPPPINKDDADLERELREALSAFKNSSGSAAIINAKLDEVARKQDAIPSMLSDLERRQQTALDVLRRDFERMFVPRAEYDPKHQFILDKLHEYDRIIAESRTSMVAYVEMQKDVKDMKEDVKALQSRGSATRASVFSVIAVVGTLVGILFQVMQHVRFLP